MEEHLEFNNLDTGGVGFHFSDWKPPVDRPRPKPTTGFSAGPVPFNNPMIVAAKQIVQGTFPPNFPEDEAPVVVKDHVVPPAVNELHVWF